ncbi:MAG: hypothetical protein M3Q99_10535 [Acidobacteriota bacterium]|nr:hypothetical protein [Acidobacteriota bacterium]
MSGKFVKSFSLFALMFLSAICVAAQGNCDLTNKNLLGVNLKMSNAQVKTVLGKALKIKNNRKGVYIFFQNYIEKPAPPPLTGVRAVYLRFYDGALYQIEIFYENQNNSQTLADFVNLQSSYFGLSTSEWQTKNNVARAVCGEISLAADVILNPHIELTDETVLAKVEEIRNKDNKE